MLTRHEQIILVQAQQAGVCIAFHTADAHLSGRLSRMPDISGSDTLPLTRELLTQMIVARRNAVSLVANTPRRAGFIRFGRGRIEIINVEGLPEAPASVAARSKRDTTDC
jgi:CRP-like cAMP-binding protein